jgi:uncharacterized membrane protein
MYKERFGFLTDGIYAIAMTLLVLQLPDPKSGVGLHELVHQTSTFLIDYALAFIVLFSFWYNHVRVNDLVDTHTRSTLLVNALILMMVCLLPFSASLLYTFGEQNSWLGNFNRAALVDIVFIAVCLCIDGLIHLNLAIIQHNKIYSGEHQQKILQVVHYRRIATAILIMAMFISFALPIPNRISLIVIPPLIIFEQEVADQLLRLWRYICKKTR